MNTKKQPVAVLASDLHFSINPPIARTAEPDWFEAMARPCRLLRKVVEKFGLPLVVAGDVFHTWKSPPELINFVLEQMPNFYAIPGQHDLPFHNLQDIRRSAYWTLVEAGKLTNLEPGKPEVLSIGTKGLPDVALHAFPWGVPLAPPPEMDHWKPLLNLAVVHAYCWTTGKGHTKADESQKVGAYAKALKGYDAAVFGDNHKGFLGMAGACVVLNNGTFMRRSSDEREYQPVVGLLMSDGTILRHPLETDDKFLPEKDPRLELDENFDLADFVSELESLIGGTLDFKQAVRHYLKTHEVSPGARKIMLQATGENSHE